MFYSDIYLNDTILLNLSRKKCREKSSTKGGNQIFKFGVGEKKEGEQKFSQNPRGEPKP